MSAASARAEFGPQARTHKVATAALAGSFVIVACGTAAPASSATAVAGESSSTSHIRSVLAGSWEGYRQVFIQPDGRVVDPMRGGVTTSEAQGYALLRAAWMGDERTFDSVWRWTAANLQGRGGGGLASLWSHGGVVDRHSASDADSDIALALLYAARRFHRSSLRGDALTVLHSIWQDDVVSIDGMNVLTGGSWATTQVSPGPVINPSYFAPYAYRTFAREDPAHPWSTLVDSSYTLLAECSSAVLDGTPGAGLPPNWCAISRSTGRVVAFPAIANANDYGYDAFRVMWRVALDAVWNHEPRARAFLERCAFLRARWDAGRRLDPVYAHDGRVVSSYDDPTVYGGDIGNFVVADPAGAAHIQALLLGSFHPSPPAYFGQADNYFEQNWVWFGLALSAGLLPDLDPGTA